MKAERSRTAPRLEAATVLVVEDDRAVRQMVRWALEMEGVRVETAADGWEALSRSAERKPDLVVLDLGLPILDGYEVAARLRSRSAGVDR